MAANDRIAREYHEVLRIVHWMYRRIMPAKRFLNTLYLLVFGLVMSKLQAAPAQADDLAAQASAAYEVCEDSDTDAAVWLDRVHGAISESLCVPVAWFDRFLATLEVQFERR